MNSTRFYELFSAVFTSKKVPLDFIEAIPDQKEFHSLDYDSLKDTVEENVEPFEFYFSYVVENVVEVLRKKMTKSE